MLGSLDETAADTAASMTSTALSFWCGAPVKVAPAREPAAVPKAAPTAFSIPLVPPRPERSWYRPPAGNPFDPFGVAAAWSGAMPFLGVAPVSPFGAFWSPATLFSPAPFASPLAAWSAAAAGSALLMRGWPMNPWSVFTASAPWQLQGWPGWWPQSAAPLAPPIAPAYRSDGGHAVAHILHAHTATVAALVAPLTIAMATFQAWPTAGPGLY